MSTEANKAVARRYFEEYLNEGKGVIGDDLFAPDYRAHVPQQQYVLSTPATLNREQHDHVSITFFQAFPDGHFTVEDMIAEGEQVVSRYTFRGTHTGTWFVLPGISPSGKLIEATGYETHRIVNGRIVEQWSLADFFGLQRQSTGHLAR